MNQQMDEIIEVFDFLGDWEQKYQYLMEMGEKLPQASEIKQDQYKVHACVSQVWVRPRRQADGSVAFEGESETPIIKGVVALLLALVNGASREEILQRDFDQLFTRLGLDKNLTPNRHVGIYAITEKMKEQVRDLS